jgi:hypothetical protein
MPYHAEHSLDIVSLFIDCQSQGCEMLESTTTQVASLVLEATVLVLAEQRETDRGQSVGLEELQALFEGVVDLDLASAVEHDDAAGSVECSSVTINDSAHLHCRQDLFQGELTTPQAGSPSRPR